MKYLLPFLVGLFITTPSFSQATLPRTSFTPVMFDYTASAPMNGEMKCVVELWRKGINYFIVNVDSQKNWQLEKAEYGVLLMKGDSVNANEIKSIFSALIVEVRLFGVNPDNVHIIRSSSVEKGSNLPKIEDVINEMGFEVIVIAPEMESTLAVLSILPETFQNSSFVLEIGFLATRISWLPDGNMVAPGSKYFLQDLNRDTVFKEVKDKSFLVPNNLRETCFILGGVPYEFAKHARRGRERYTVLNAPGDYKAEGNKQKAGLNIYDAVAQATGCKQFVFDWDANFAIGFLLTL